METRRTDEALVFSVHSALRFEVVGTCSKAVDGIARDFWFFRSSEATEPRLVLRLDQSAPDYSGLPTVPAAIYTPRNAVYHDGERRILDFGGRGLAVLDESKGTFHVRSQDADLVYEAAYLFLLSQIGKACEERGLVRLHALAVAVGGRSILAVLPMGGGKSTLGRALLADQSVSVLSDDSPFIDREGRAFAFPLHLGLLGEPGGEVPREHVRRVERMEFGTKYLVDPEWFGARIAAQAVPGLLVIGRRTLAEAPRAERATYRVAMKALLPAMVLGVGLFQGLEYLLRSSAAELLGRIGVVLRRLRHAHALTRASDLWLVDLGRDAEANARLVRELADRPTRRSR